MDETSFIQNQNSRKVFALKGYSNVWSESADANFHMTFVVYVSADNSVTLTPLILPGKRLNRYVLEGCYIEGASITTAQKGSISVTLFLSWLEFFSKYVPDSVACPLVLVYYGYSSHYNN